MDENDDIKAAIKELEEMSGNDELRRMAELRLKAIRDEHAAISLATKRGLKQGLEQGLSQGLERGIQERNIEIAKNMLKKRMKIEDIKEITGLTEQVIHSLQTDDA